MTMHTYFSHSASRASRIAATVTAAALLFIGVSCSENLPNGPNTFPASIKIVVPHDTIVVGDSSVVQAQATDAEGHVIQGLGFTWSSADSATVGFAAVPTGNADAESGRTRSLVAKRTGRSVVTLTLPDPRFVVSSVTRTETAVLAGVRVLTSHDSTLTAINDTAVAIAAGLVHANGANVTRVSTGIKWVHLGTHTTVVGTGDTIKYIARSNGPDTLIATHDFCLVTGKCADTVIARVAQQLIFTLSGRNFLAWSFGDSLGPTITLADRRGSGLAGTSVRFVPRTPADSLIVRTTPPIGTSNPVNGAMAAPLLVSQGNGTAHVAVLGIATDGSVVAVDSITETVRQVARRVNIEPLRALETGPDSIPIRPVARDARGAAIADATVLVTPAGIPVNTINNILWAGPTGVTGATAGSITPSVIGSSLPENNPLAPQVPVIVNGAIISLIPMDSVVAGGTPLTITTQVLDSLGNSASGKFVQFSALVGTVPDPVQVDGNGNATVIWAPPTIVGRYTLTGVLGTQLLFSLPDSAGRIIIRRSVTVYADVPSELFSNVVVNPNPVAKTANAVVTITARDRFGNISKAAKGTDFTLTPGAGGGTLSPISCSFGICTATYTAPDNPGPGNITDTFIVTLTANGAPIQNSPITMTITP
jgi:hypothetical protein